MSDYDFQAGGSLKLKGGVVDGGIVKKKKKKSKRKKSPTGSRTRTSEGTLVSRRGIGRRRLPEVAEFSSYCEQFDRKTEAEKRFEEAQKRRLAQRVAKLATKTHKDRVNEFNSHLESLSEHHDIPKVGPG
ncbi:hypothetical protein BD779DRAFT_1666749 [Infundibulicybe gibba]|nr:hypothetical protein BD779DRAFT_1666749 [Infundibulicybe gibba]